MSGTAASGVDIALTKLENMVPTCQGHLEQLSDQVVEDRPGDTVIFPVGYLLPLEHTIYTT